MPVSGESVSVAIGALYEAAYGVRDWPEAIAEIANLFDGSHGWLFGIGADHLVAHTSVADPEFHSTAAFEAIMRDPASSITRVQLPGTTPTHTELYDVPAFRARELWQDWMRPRDLYFGLQYHLPDIAGMHLFLDISRGKSQDDFGGQEKKLMRLLGPHLTRAGQISAILSRQAFGNAQLGAYGNANLVVDAALRVIDINAQAEELLSQTACGIELSGGHLTGKDTILAPLRKLVDECMSAALNFTGRTILLQPDLELHSSRLVASVAPLRNAHVFGFDRPALVVIFLRKPYGSAAPHVEACLIDLFRLPPSHAKLACALASGISLRQAAAERGLTYATARSYLEVILNRTNTRRQTELVALLKTLELTVPQR